MKAIKLNFIALLLFGISGVFAQQQTATVSAKATGIQGVVNYTVGQTLYNNITAANGSLQQGIQQAYEITTTLGIELIDVNLSVKAYPNPTIDRLHLSMDIDNYKNPRYQLQNLQGSLIKEGNVLKETTALEMSSLPAAVYLLAVYNNNKLIKLFKIIKN